MIENKCWFIEFNNINKRGSLYSWDSISETIMCKHIDKSCLRYNGSAIPVKLKSFFGANELTSGETINVKLLCMGKEFHGHITVENHQKYVHTPRTRIFWNKALSDIMRSINSNLDKSGVIVFEKSQNTENTYYVYIGKYNSNTIE